MGRAGLPLFDGGTGRREIVGIFDRCNWRNREDDDKLFNKRLCGKPRIFRNFCFCREILSASGGVSG